MPDKSDFGDTPKESYTLLYTGRQRRTSCAELFSFILACKLDDNHEVYYNSAYFNESYYDDSGKPRRYAICDQEKVYYYKGSDGIGFYNDQGTYYGKDVDEAFNILNAK